MDSDTKREFSLIKTDISELKDDVSVLKTDVSALKTDVSTLKKDFAVVKKTMGTLVTRVEFDYFVNYITENMYTKKEHAEYMTFIDEVVQEIRDSREGRILTEKHVLELDDKSHDHGRRITTLEDKVL